MRSHAATGVSGGQTLVSDDQNNRVVGIDLALHRIVWQYGTMGVSGAGPDQWVGSTDAKAVGEPLPPYGYQSRVSKKR